LLNFFSPTIESSQTQTKSWLMGEYILPHVIEVGTFNIFHRPIGGSI